MQSRRSAYFPTCSEKRSEDSDTGNLLSLSLHAERTEPSQNFSHIAMRKALNIWIYKGVGDTQIVSLQGNGADGTGF